MPDHQTSPVGEDADLLPCPFCGATADLMRDEDDCPYVACSLCDISLPSYMPQYKANAVSDWNRRAAPTQPKAQVGASIDTPEFRDLVSKIWQALDLDARDERIKPLIAHIDAWAGSRTGDAVPDGWQSVPPKPTDDIVVAFAEAWYSQVRCIDDPQMDNAYAAMLAAAPAPSKQAGNDQEAHNRAGKEQG